MTPANADPDLFLVLTRLAVMACLLILVVVVGLLVGIQGRLDRNYRAYLRMLRVLSNMDPDTRTRILEAMEQEALGPLDPDKVGDNDETP